MRTNHLIKLGGAFAIVSFLFFPVAGCGDNSFSGIDIMKDNSISSFGKLLSALIVLAGIAVLFSKKRKNVFYASITGLILMFILLYPVIFWPKKEVEGIDLTMKLKSGSYLCILGFIISAILSKVDKELFIVNSKEK